MLSLWSFQGTRRLRLHRPRGPVSQNSTAWNFEVDVLLGESELRTAPFLVTPGDRLKSVPGMNGAINRSNAYRSNGSGIPRKEVIQPQLPLRLPCYDFTPITSPTFDGSLP